jgi:aldehyde dehydrogenase (NAD+)
MELHKNYIDGQWLEGFEVNHDINPSDTNEVVGEYARANEAQAEEAIAAARRALDGWKNANIQQRHDALDRVGTEILARREELGRLLAREEGKTVHEGIGEVTRAGMIFKFFAGEALRSGGELIPSVRPGGIEVDVTREPVGVVGIVTPWNFPIAIPAWKIAPALAFGNCVVFKPADLTPGCGWAVAEIISRSGLPQGVFNLVMGSGSEVGRTLVNSPDVAAITFTGSVPVGRHIRAAAAPRGAKIQLEMGGKNPMIVLDDADLERAVAASVDGAFYQTGQRCTASSRLIVTDGVHDAFVEAVTERIKSLRVDNALKEGTEMGPAVSREQLDLDLDYIRIGKEEGADLVWGGEPLERETPGFYLSPALFTGTHNDMRMNREEIFGPVAGVIRVKDYEEAVEVANDTEFGLCSGICTTSLKYAHDFKRRSAVGVVMVNLPTAGIDYHVPFGGRKDSSYGTREQGTYAKEFYTNVKTTYVAP